ncbi:uracil-DNA glycosylase [Leptolyngbya cf. ectocarpi LEGE 11479]|uniref:Type-4 uracil-DNA glycosylase n=1 Tax=Leptolyngbya cf. ectocarpi LEGE 11479 TaxID=1828722 RepID=A0A928X1H1_LEPEC|nr:uracil-DNA glycosylase [Leptolyngbya ectocarpi]MBE9066081.1 uracil-DNA glycosylase [Leptolyngbya cf. ectocarpi LEGE 11479]
MTEQIGLFGGQPAPAAAALSPEDWEQIPTSASIPIPPGTYEDLDQLASHCNQCQRCDLASGRTNVVISRGSPKASIMIIGEGPGQNEDEQGKPFVGKSGQLLEKILASVRLDTQKDVYICNVVKCRPPGNRNPTAGEIAACVPYLKEQVRLVDPKIILLTGNTALKGLLDVKQGITKVRGNWMEWEGRYCMAIFHPAYLLRNPSRDKGKPKWLMWQDIQAIRKKLDELSA